MAECEGYYGDMIRITKYSQTVQRTCETCMVDLEKSPLQVRQPRPPAMRAGSFNVPSPGRRPGSARTGDRCLCFGGSIILIVVDRVLQPSRILRRRRVEQRVRGGRGRLQAIGVRHE